MVKEAVYNTGIDGREKLKHFLRKVGFTRLFFLAAPVACGSSQAEKGLNLCHSNDPRFCSDNAGSLTPCATGGTPPPLFKMTFSFLLQRNIGYQ